MNTYIHFNGKIVEAGKEIITAGNRGLRYGDGLFETMKVINGTIQLASFHFERLFHGMAVLQMQLPGNITATYLAGKIIELCRENNCAQAARVRLNIFRGNGSLYTVDDPHPYIIIQAEAAPTGNLQWNETGLTLDVYTEVKKSCDLLSNLKSNNYLPYVMGALYAQKNGLNDCLLLNSYNRICDATIANVWCVQGNTIYTPPLSEGCVAGVMRRFLIEKMGEMGMQEKPLTTGELLQADEVFLTNASYGIRWVQQIQHKKYANTISAGLYNTFIKNFQPMEL